jgi:DNA helicase II / ATP-dependent DNA helicase PcrA
MDKRIILAVAGSGKTTYLVDKLCLEKRALIITYTINNTLNLKNSIIDKFGYLPNNIKLVSYFSFIYNFCYKPYLADRVNAKGISWKRPPQNTFKLNRSKPEYYINKRKRLYNSRIAKLIETQKIMPQITKRLEKYYDYLYIDEVQDFAGHDFDFLLSLTEANVSQLFVGDFFQHTFDTSNDGTTNKKLFDDFKTYIKRFEDKGIVIDLETLKNSHRCSKTVCEFVRDKIGVQIFSTKAEETKVIFIEEQEEADKIYCDDSIVKLFYQKANQFECYSENWGKSKGENKYRDVCVVLNDTTFNSYNGTIFKNLASQTKNKLYVACTRAKGNLYFVQEKMYRKNKKKE